MNGFATVEKYLMLPIDPGTMFYGSTKEFKVVEAQPIFDPESGKLVPELGDG